MAASVSILSILGCVMGYPFIHILHGTLTISLIKLGIVDQEEVNIFVFWSNFLIEINWPCR